MSLLGEVSIRQQGPIAIATLTGEVDVSNAGQVGVDLFEAAPNDAAGLIIDLTPTTYLDSRGVQLLIELAERLRRREQQIRVVTPDRSVVRRILTLTRLDTILPLDATIEEAVEAMLRAR